MSEQLNEKPVEAAVPTTEATAIVAADQKVIAGNDGANTIDAEAVANIVLERLRADPHLHGHRWHAVDHGDGPRSSAHLGRRRIRGHRHLDWRLDRCRRSCRHHSGQLEAELDILQVEKRIRGRVKRQMEKSQREYYLNEQVKAIQKELGEGEEGADLE
jgi:hypothetical protein